MTPLPPNRPLAETTAAPPSKSAEAQADGPQVRNNARQGASSHKKPAPSKGKGKAIEIEDDDDPRPEKGKTTENSFIYVDPYAEGAEDDYDEEELMMEEMEDDEDGPGEEEQRDEDGKGAEKERRGRQPRRQLKKGPVPAAGVSEIQALGDEFRARAAQLAIKYEKTRGTIIRMAGFGIRSSRASSVWNEFQSWFAEKYAKELEDGQFVPLLISAVRLTFVLIVPPEEHRRRKMQKWNEVMEGVAKDDDEEKRRRMEPLNAELAELRKDSKDPEVVYRTAPSRIRAACRQFTDLVSRAITIRPFIVTDCAFAGAIV